MSDTRIFPKMTSRATGIQRTTTQVARPTMGGHAASSHVSASAGAGRQAQAQAQAGRRPTPGPRDTSVAIVDRRAAASPSGQHAKVEIVKRATPTATSSPFTIDQLMLIGHLLEKYLEGARAVMDFDNAKIADDALGVAAGLMKSAPPTPTSTSAHVPAPAVPPVQDATVVGPAKVVVSPRSTTVVEHDDSSTGGTDPKVA